MADDREYKPIVLPNLSVAKGPAGPILEIGGAGRRDRFGTFVPISLRSGLSGDVQFARTALSQILDRRGSDAAGRAGIAFSR